MQKDIRRFEAIYTIVVAAGKGMRMNTEVPKQLLLYGGRTVLQASVEAFALRPDMTGVVVASPEDGSLDEAYSLITSEIERGSGRPRGSIRIVRGGEERRDSVKAGLKAVAEETASAGIDPSAVAVLIHDAARPGIEQESIDAGLEAMKTCEAVTTAYPAVDSIRMISESALKEASAYPIITSANVDRRLVYQVQTPQIFMLSDILAAYERADRDGFKGTDDASVAEHAGLKVAIVKGSLTNSKLTTREDIRMVVRTGIGYDVHRLVPGRPLILCGTQIPAELGLDGHSDADVATHALMDALLGAAGMGDIGRHFPDTDEKYRGADSLRLLAEVRYMLGDAVINNADITIIAEGPKLAPYNQQMRHNISRVLGVPESAVNIKATTEESLGFTGRGEGIAAIATCSIEGSF